MQNKVISSFREAVADIPDGATIMIGGFGHAVDKPQNLIGALRDHGAKGLTMIVNGAGVSGSLGIGSLGGKPFIDEEILLQNKQIKKAICSVPASLVMSKPGAFEKQYLAGEAELEYVPQGTLAERIRAGGAGLGGVFTPTGVGTLVGERQRKANHRRQGDAAGICLAGGLCLYQSPPGRPDGEPCLSGDYEIFYAVMATAAKVVIVEAEQ